VATEKKGHRYNGQIVFLLVLLTSPVFVSIVSASTDPMNESRIHKIIWEDRYGVDFVDPHLSYIGYNWIHLNVYETLYTYPFDSEDTYPLEPLLAESLIVSSDGLTHTFTLRQGVTFHDGTSFNATCVQMNFWRMLGRGWDDGFGPVWMVAEPILGGQAIEEAVFEYGDGSPQHIGNWTDWVENSEAIEVLDTYEVRIHLAYPYAPFLSVLSYGAFSMISPTYFMTHGGMAPGGNTYTEMVDHTCGTGPYKLQGWTSADPGENIVGHIDFTQYDNYWRADSAVMTQPYAGSITDVTIMYSGQGTDTDGIVSNLQEGVTDICYWSIFDAYDIWNNITDRGDGTLQSLDPDIKVWTGLPSYSTSFLGFNMNDYLNYSGEIVQNPFKFWDLRAAISYAFDYDASIDEIYNGVGMQLQGPIPNGMFGHDDDLYMYTKDLNEAVIRWNAAMAAGLDDIWENASYELNLYYNQGNDAREKLCLLIKQALEEIIAHADAIEPTSPLTINVTGLPWGGGPSIPFESDYVYGYVDMLRNRELPIYFLSWSSDFADPHNFVLPFIRSDSTYAYRMGLENSTSDDGSLWDSDTVDGWIDAASRSQSPPERITLYRQIQETIVDHCAFLWGYQGVEFHVERHELNGYVYNPMRQPYFYNYYKSTGTIYGPLNIPIEILAAAAVVMVIILVVMLKRKK
jgi:peptide/nickel transport system substrate-binding protein